VRKEKNVSITLVEKPEGKRPHAQPKGKWEDNIKLVL
jgi:hypothetical protein